jgi:hypothetical protein
MIMKISFFYQRCELAVVFIYMIQNWGWWKSNTQTQFHIANEIIILACADAPASFQYQTSIANEIIILACADAPASFQYQTSMETSGGGESDPEMARKSARGNQWGELQSLIIYYTYIINYI